MAVFTLMGIVICLMHSAMFSGLNLGFFGLSRLRLEVQAEANNLDAIRILKLRKDAHWLLATILWGNVSVNVLLTLLTDSILPVAVAFMFSTFFITLFGEIIPQAYFAKHALQSSKVLAPVIRFYQFLLYPIAKPSGLLLDALLGKEEIGFFQEEEIKVVLKRHALSGLSDVGHLESLGAVNFLALDDVKVEHEGEVINPMSIIELPTSQIGSPLFPEIEKNFEDPFLQTINASGEKWVIITNKNKQPVLVLNADQFLRDALYSKETKNILTYCHHPIIVTDPDTRLGEVILKFKVQAENPNDDVVDNDLILYWNSQKKIITGADLLGRLLRGIVERSELKPKPNIKDKAKVPKKLKVLL